MCEEDSFVLRLMNLEGSREVKLNNALKFAKEGLVNEILGFVVVGVSIDETFILLWGQWDRKQDKTGG